MPPEEIERKIAESLRGLERPFTALVIELDDVLELTSRLTRVCDNLMRSRSLAARLQGMIEAIPDLSEEEKKDYMEALSRVIYDFTEFCAQYLIASRLVTRARSVVLE